MFKFAYSPQIESKQAARYLLLPIKHVSKFFSIRIKAALFLSFNALLLFSVEGPYFDLIDSPLPFCDIPRVFDSSHHTFVEIRNQLPGKSAYNALVQDYQRQQWQKFDSKIDKFRVEFESSRLQEAVEFIDFQAEVERLNPEAPEALLHSERHFRELLILYPRSLLVPTVQLSFANFYIRNQRFAKGLGLVRQLRRNFPFHSDHCYFMFSEAEAQYQLKSLSDAKRTYQAILQQCQSKKLRLGSKIRLLDIVQAEQPRKSYFDDFEALRTKESALVQRFFPEVILNLGETAFRERKYEKSLFFLNEFRRNIGGRHICTLNLTKRLADISMRKEQPDSQVLGNYLEVFELFPKSNLGKFSRIVALSYSGEKVATGEFQRREKAIREIIPQISEKSLNLRAQVLYLVISLKRQNQRSLEASNALLMLKTSNPSLFEGKLDEKIKTDLLELQRKKTQIYPELSRNSWEKWYWETTLQLYEEWFKLSSQESQFKNLISNQVLELSLEKASKRDFESLLKSLSFWSETPCFEGPKQNSSRWSEIINSILVGWMEQSSKKQKEITHLITKNQIHLKKIFNGEGQVLWIKSALENDRTEDLKDLLGPWRSSRKIASQYASRNIKLASASNLVVGQGLRKIKEFSQSDKYLSLVTAPEFTSLSVLEQMRNARDQKKFKKGVQLGLSGLKKSTGSNQKAYLELLSEAVKTGQQWQFADAILKLIKEIKIGLPQKAMLLQVVGISKFGQGKFKEATYALEESLALDSDETYGAETSFYLARSFAKLGNLKQAKEALTKLASKNDEFWSPLAETEIKLLETNEQN